MKRPQEPAVPDYIRLENALRIWVNDIRPKHPKGEPYRVAGLAYEECIRLAALVKRQCHELEVLQLQAAKRRASVQRRWDLRKQRRPGQGPCPGDRDTRLCDSHVETRHEAAWAALSERERKAARGKLLGSDFV